jgi:long-chain fatty acid transport protein
LANKELDIGMTVPQEFRVSLYQDITDRLALVADFGWQDWSQFQRVDVNISTPTGTTLTTQLEFKDTYHYAVGARYRISDPWMVMAGFAYDTSAMDESSRSPSMPLDRQFRYAAGFQYDWSEKLSIGGVYEFMDAGEAPINRTRGPLSGTLIGDYSSDYYNFLACYVSYKF